MDPRNALDITPTYVHISLKRLLNSLPHSPEAPVSHGSLLEIIFFPPTTQRPSEKCYMRGWFSRGMEKKIETSVRVPGSSQMVLAISNDNGATTVATTTTIISMMMMMMFLCSDSYYNFRTCICIYREYCLLQLSSVNSFD